MDARLYKSGAVETPPDPPASPSLGYPISGDNSTGQAASVPGPYRDYMIGQSLQNIIEAAGLTPDHTDLTLLRQAIVKLVSASNHVVRLEDVTFGPSVSDGDAVYWDNANSRYDRAIADGTDKQKMVGFADVTNSLVEAFGRSALFSGLTAGAPYYLSDSTAGAISSTAPSEKVAVGLAKSATVMFVDIDPDDGTPIQDQTTWNTGTDNTESIISPAKLDAKIKYSVARFASVRQTVQTGPIDSNGRADFISDNGGLSVITDDLTVTPLILSYGDGFDEKGEVNITVKLESNLTWSGLTDDAVNYLYVDYDDSGNVASATASTLPPDYRQAPETDISSPSSGQFWYPTKHRSRGKTYNGSSWDSGLRVCVGQATASSGSITDVVSYAYQGNATQDFTSLTAGSGFSFNHNIGVPFDLLIAKRKLRIDDPVSNFVTGEVMDLDFQPIGTGTSSIATGVKLVSVPTTERTAVLNNVGNQSTFNQLLETTGNSNNAVSVSKTSLKTLIQRAF
jgi:hypothetical protein